MEYEAKTEDDLALEGLMDKGEFDAEIMTAEEATDKEDREMFALKLRVWDASGAERHVHDHVSPHWFAWKFRHLHVASGLLSVYEKGKTDADQLRGKTVRVMIGIESKGKFPARNIITDYLVPTGETISRTTGLRREAPAVPVEGDDDAPF